MLDDLVDLVLGGSTGVPDGLCMIAPETSYKLMKAKVCDESEMGGRVTGIHTATTIAFQQGDRATCLLEQVGGGHPRNSTTDDRDVYLQIRLEAGEPREFATNGLVRLLGHEASNTRPQMIRKAGYASLSRVPGPGSLAPRCDKGSPRVLFVGVLVRSLRVPVGVLAVLVCGSSVLLTLVMLTHRVVVRRLMVMMSRGRMAGRRLMMVLD